MTDRERVCEALSDIRLQLWAGHMAVMIGAGFSLNAQRKDETKPMPPKWSELATNLSAKLYPSAPVQEVLAKKDALRLGEEYEAKFGRDALEQWLRECIDDENLTPGELHRKLFKLPWHEVFTTNYDTLLEQTARDVYERRFDVVHDKREILESESPRIIKLHGSVDRSDRPLIFTAEDYRKFPREQEPLVNTVRQVLMENSLCLIGFSGTDPNFLGWIGWVRDIFKEEIRKIYLIGATGLSESEIAALEKQGVTPVDLSTYYDKCEGKIDLELAAFLDDLNHNPLNTDWKTSPCRIEHKLTDQEVIAKIEAMEQERSCYPNYAVLPWERLDTSVAFSNMLWGWSFARVASLPSPWDLRGMCALVWRFDRCMFPLINDRQALEAIESVISRNEPVLRREMLDGEDWGLYCKLYVELLFARLRQCRDFGDVGRWRELNDLLDLEINRQDAEQVNRLFFERAMLYLLEPDIQKLEAVLLDWGEAFRPPEWNVRYASILLELGRTDEGAALVKSTLAEIRPKLPRGNVKTDLKLFGIEGVILMILNMVEGNDAKKRSENRSRLKQLANLECHPWFLLERLEIALSAPERKIPDVSVERDLDQDRSTWHMSNVWPEELTRAFQMLRAFEETGLPLHADQSPLVAKGVAGAIARVLPYTPGWALGMYLRIGKGSSVSLKDFFGFGPLCRLTRSEADRLANDYVGQVGYILSNHLDAIRAGKDNYYNKLASNLVDVISRLTYRCGPDSLQRIFDLGLRIYSTHVPRFGLPFGDMCRYFERVLSAMTPEVVFGNLERLLSIEIPTDRNDFLDWQNPFHVDWRGYTHSDKDLPLSLEARLEWMIAACDTDNYQYRSDVFLWWFQCEEVGIVNADRRCRMSEVMMRHVGKDGLPSVRYLNKVAFPEVIDAPGIVERLGKYYGNYDFPILDGMETKNHYVGNVANPTSNFSSSILYSSSVFADHPKCHLELGEDECLKMLSRLEASISGAAERIKDVLQEGLIPGVGETIRDRLHNYDLVVACVIVPRVRAMPRLDDFVAQLKSLGLSDVFPITRIAVAGKSGVVTRELENEYISVLASSQGCRISQYTQALTVAYEMNGKFGWVRPSDNCIYVLVSAVSMGNADRFDRACTALVGVARGDGLSERVIDSIDIILKRMLDHIEDGDGNRFSDGERLKSYEKAARLAAVLYGTYGAAEHVGLDAWKTYCLGERAFSTFRNIWLKNVK